MSVFKDNYTSFLKDIEENMKNKEDLEYVKKRFADFLDIVIDQMDNIMYYKKEQIEELENKQKELEEKSGVTQQRIIKELAKMAFADIRKAYDNNGNLKSIQDLDDDTAGAIIGVESFEEYEGRGDDREYVGDTKKVKMADKIRAAELLGKHLGMFKEKIEISKSSEDTIKEIDEYIKKKVDANE